jgi:transposase
MDKKEIKEAIVAEYLSGGVTFRELEEKYGTNFRTIHRWVNEYKKGKWAREAAVERSGRLALGDESEMPWEVRELRKELEEARLYNKLLNTMIDIAEEQMGIPIRKKSGAKQ